MIQTPSVYGLAYLIPYAVVLVAAIVLTIVLVRLILAATRTLNAITAERTLLTDLKLGEGDDADEPDTDQGRAPASTS